MTHPLDAGAGSGAGDVEAIRERHNADSFKWSDERETQLKSDRAMLLFICDRLTAECVAERSAHRLAHEQRSTLRELQYQTELARDEKVQEVERLRLEVAGTVKLRAALEAHGWHFGFGNHDQTKYCNGCNSHWILSHRNHRSDCLVGKALIEGEP